MDTGSGEFKKITDETFAEEMKKLNPMVFKTGEVLDIRGSRFRVQSIMRKKMILRLLPQLKISSRNNSSSNH